MSCGRWWKFNLVGAIGILVQLTVLAVLKTGLHINYVAATAIAVETAVIHNYIWHERLTWADRGQGSLLRFCRFNLTVGGASLAGNVFSTRLLVELAGCNYLLANAISVAVCSLVNFVVNDRIVFRRA